MSDSKAGCSVCDLNSSFPKEGLHLCNIFFPLSLPPRGTGPNLIPSLPFLPDSVWIFSQVWSCRSISSSLITFLDCSICRCIFDVFSWGEVSSMSSYSTILIFSEFKAMLLLKTLQWLSISVTFFTFFKHVKCVLASLSILLPFVFSCLLYSNVFLIFLLYLMSLYQYYLSSAYVKSNSLVIYLVFYFSVI